ncbi:WXG100 family type VII secretion target [Crossiella cryophila]|uniref:ESAT-6-like protein n=1 Tax=Crossiella cryophila TaxID=43355 RepID=A0A7W7CEZ9_9PSEU|nr:WXG100 family type VII secretion target [Crossiella cryophila]MBB4679875.1 WXG100 family type VII secretion target [Crossiella cryophila]
MSGYGVTPANLQQLVDIAKEAANNVTRELHTLEADLQATLKTWTGQAQSQYDIQQKKWNTAAQAMPRTLDVASGAAQSIHDVYVRTEQSNVNALGG